MTARIEARLRRLEARGGADNHSAITLADLLVAMNLEEQGRPEEAVLLLREKVRRGTGGGWVRRRTLVAELAAITGEEAPCGDVL